MRAILIAVLGVVGCGGSAGQSVSPAGSWVLADTLQSGSCAAAPAETVTVIGNSSGYVLRGYAMTASFCGDHYCELQGSAGTTNRDLVFYSDGAAGGTRSNIIDPGNVAANCYFSTSAHRP